MIIGVSNAIQENQQNVRHVTLVGHLTLNMVFAQSMNETEICYLEEIVNMLNVTQNIC